MGSRNFLMIQSRENVPNEPQVSPHFNDRATIVNNEKAKQNEKDDHSAIIMFEMQRSGQKKTERHAQ